MHEGKALLIYLADGIKGGRITHLEPSELASICAYMAEMEYQASRVNDLFLRNRELLAENNELKGDAMHWKANHDNQVNRARVLIDRCDLPFERVRAYERYAEIEADAARYQYELILEYGDYFERCGIYNLTPMNFDDYQAKYGAMIDANIKGAE